MKQLIIAISFLCSAGYSFCQETPPPPPIVIGGTVYTFQYEDIKGSPFLNDKWAKATIITYDRKIYKNENLKFDLYRNKFVFNRDDKTYELTPEVSTVYLFPNEADTSAKLVYKKGYQINNFITTNNYLQVLAEGKITFLKSQKKNMEEFSEYNDATKYKRFRVAEQYFIFKNSQYSQVTLNAKNLEAALEPKWNEVALFIRQNNISAKDEKGWIAAISFYNSL